MPQRRADVEPIAAWIGIYFRYRGFNFVNTYIPNLDTDFPHRRRAIAIDGLNAIAIDSRFQTVIHIRVFREIGNQQVVVFENIVFAFLA